MSGPVVPFSEEIHARKYRLPGETFGEAMRRVSSGLADSPSHFYEFYDALNHMRFLPAGRILASIGQGKNTTPYNCFVSGTIEDSFVEGEGSIMHRATEAATTMRMGGGIGYDFSTLRPRGALIKKLRSKSSGPVSFMDIFNAICLCTASTDNRRGAQMGVLRVDHPDILEFVKAKQNNTSLQGFNISVAVTDEFMNSVYLGKNFELRWAGEVYDTVSAQELWEQIMLSTYDWAEPGVLFIDTINRTNNLSYCEQITTTNPCGEQPLPPFGACLLGSFALPYYMRSAGHAHWFDWDQFSADIPAVVRAMDNVVDAAIYPLEAQKKEAKDKRRMGLGITGLANAAELLGYRYGSKEFRGFESRILSRLAREAYIASAELAREKGSFPLFDKDRYLAQPAFASTLEEDVQDLIRRYGIRNSHLTSIAPTGTISLTANNISSSIEPVFSHEYQRTVIEFDGPRQETIKDYAFAQWGVKGKTANEVTPKEHVQVLTTAAQHVDSAVSKTCNVPADVEWEDFKNIYFEAWAGGAKGCTTYRMGGRRGAILEVKSSEETVVEGASCTFDPETGRKSCE